MTGPVRVAIVGTGGIARIHLEALRELNDRALVVAAVDIDGDRARSFANRHGIVHAGTDLRRAMAQTAPDLVHVCTPPGAHLGPAREALAAGAHVLVEKPPALSLREPGHEERVALAWKSGAAGVTSGHRAQFDEVLAAVARGAPPPVEVAETRRTLSLVAGIYASAFTGRPVTPAGLGPGSEFYDRMQGSGPPWEMA